MSDLEKTWENVASANSSLANLLSWFGPKTNPDQQRTPLKIPNDCEIMFKTIGAPVELMIPILKHVDFGDVRLSSGLSNPEFVTMSQSAIAGELSKLFRASIDFARAEQKISLANKPLIVPQRPDDIIAQAVKIIEQRGGDPEMGRKIFTALVRKVSQWNKQYLGEGTGPFRDFSPTEQ